MRRTTSFTFHARSALAFGSLAVACNQLLSIEEAQVDPTLSGRSGSTSSGGSIDNEAGEAGNAMGGLSSRGGTSNQTSLGGGNSTDAGSNSLGGTGHGGSSGAGGDDAGSGETGEAGAAGAPAGSLCDEYCTQITTYCTGDTAQYKDREQCMTVCQAFPQGTVTGPDENSVGCRLRYAGKARYAGGVELAAYCRQSGPGGDGRCGSNCDGMCDVAMATCNTPETEPYNFPSREACMSTCSGLPQVVYSYNSLAVADGNSVQCRLFHVISAAMMDPEEHCAHVMGVTLCEAAATQ